MAQKETAFTKEINRMLAACTYEEIDSVQTTINRLKKEKYDEHMKSEQEKYKKRQKAYAVTRKKFHDMIPLIKEWLGENLKSGDIIQCKGYRGYKKVTEVVGDSVYAMCGYFRKDQFQNSGYGSNTTIYYVTHIFRDGKFQKVKDLMVAEPKTKKLCPFCYGAGDIRVSSIESMLGSKRCDYCDGTGFK